MILQALIFSEWGQEKWKEYSFVYLFFGGKDLFSDGVRSTQKEALIVSGLD